MLRTRMLKVTLVMAALMSRVNAQEPALKAPDPTAFLDHVTNAKLLAANDLRASLVDCSLPPVNAAATVTTVSNAPPTKVFDQLYYLGTNSVASWAIVTSEGIIQIDSLDNPEEAERLIVGGYKKLGLDPTRMKYLVLTHGHSDHFGGSKYLQDNYHPHILMSAADWHFARRRRLWGYITRHPLQGSSRRSLALRLVYLHKRKSA